MYHLDGNPAPSDQVLLKDLIEITTAKWQTFTKKKDAQAQEDSTARPSACRGSTQSSLPKSAT